MLKSKGKIQVGIYLISILMMGVVGIASAISVIGANFPELSQTDVQTSFPSVHNHHPVTLIVGKLMQVMSKKLLAIIGIILFLIGGLVPAFMTSFLALQILRGVFGVGVGILQVVSTALVAENFEGAERDRVQGNPAGLPDARLRHHGLCRRLARHHGLEHRVLCAHHRRHLPHRRPCVSAQR